MSKTDRSFIAFMCMMLIISIVWLNPFMRKTHDFAFQTQINIQCIDDDTCKPMEALIDLEHHDLSPLKDAMGAETTGLHTDDSGRVSLYLARESGSIKIQVHPYGEYQDVWLPKWPVVGGSNNYVVRIRPLHPKASVPQPFTGPANSEPPVPDAKTPVEGEEPPHAVLDPGPA